MTMAQQSQDQHADTAKRGEKRAGNTRGEASIQSIGKRKRVRNFTPDDRAAHRVFEKSRREAFREKLIELASFLPTLSETEPNRLSKHIVVHESIERHREQNQHIQELQRERDELLAEVNRWRAGASAGGSGDVALEARSAQSFVYRTAGEWDGFLAEGIAGASEGFGLELEEGASEIGSPSPRSPTGPERDTAALAAILPPSSSQGSIPTQGVWAAQPGSIAAPATTTATSTLALPSIPPGISHERTPPDQTWLESPDMMRDGRPWDFEVQDLNTTQIQPDQIGSFDPVSIPLFAGLPAFHGTAEDTQPDQADLPQRLDHTPFIEEPLNSLDQLYWVSR
ncbi:hypothetical protein F5Y04DRAFT_71562 [Hypomontagnella monticulosa]|nr:hypothetical protein F5Y04DRAFT_71562 [Hypomontagnella monticulosa]